MKTEWDMSDKGKTRERIISDLKMMVFRLLFMELGNLEKLLQNILTVVIYRFLIFLMMRSIGLQKRL